MAVMQAVLCMQEMARLIWDGMARHRVHGQVLMMSRVCTSGKTH